LANELFLRKLLLETALELTENPKFYHWFYVKTKGGSH